MTDQAKLSAPLSPVREHWMPTEQAIEQYLAYEERYSRGHALLACHAAFPLIVTPELVNLIRLNFLADQTIDWLAETDFLLAFCQPIDAGLGLYQIDPGLRDVMLSDLQESDYGVQRLYELADFLLAYRERYTESLRNSDIASVHQCIAWSYLYPQKLINDLRALLLLKESFVGSKSQLPIHQLRIVTIIEIIRETFELGPPILEKEYQELLKTSHMVLRYWYPSEYVSKILSNVQNETSHDSLQQVNQGKNVQETDREPNWAEKISTQITKDVTLGITSESTEFEDDVSPSHIASLYVDLNSTLISRSSRFETSIEIDEQANSQPFEAVAIELKRLPPLPTADYSSSIHIEPSKEEQQAFDQLFQALPPNFTRKEYELLLRAYKIASYAHRKQQRESGEPYMLHPIAVTKILVDIHMDVNTLAAGLLHDVAEDSEFSIEYIQEQFGPVVSMLVDGVTKLKNINELGNTRSAVSDSKEDFRVVLIQLADRLHNMRTLGSQKDFKRRQIARETLEIFAPLAERLGIWKLQSELEDLSFRYLEPTSYRDIVKAIQQKQDERDKWVIRIKVELERELAKAGIPAEVSARTKHIYSIWRKMKRKEVSFDQIYDVYGFRVIVENEAHCYFALGIVHSLWHPIPGEFNDYIANPKNNMYRSLHTAVLSKRNGRPMEVQICTHEMHEVAEYGIAAHW